VTSGAGEIARLWRERPRSRLVRATLGAFVLLGGGALWSLRVGFADLLGPHRLDNLERFLEQDARPFELRSRPFSWVEAWEWVATKWSALGLDAALATLWIALVAIVLAGLLGSLLAFLGARVLAERDPFVARRRDAAWRPRVAIAGGVRGLSVLLRAVPEYVLAFVFLALFGADAWPAVLALALHNGGILGRLGAETIENVDPRPIRALRVAGAQRVALALFGLVPAALGRFLSYFFYRFETCVREATVLGMLGIASLGSYVEEARARQRYDEMLFLVAVAALLVVAVDLLSHAARRWVRREGG